MRTHVLRATPKTIAPARILATAMTVVQNYVQETNAAASAGSSMRIPAGGGLGILSFTYTGPSAYRNIKVAYFDENDGACTVLLKQNGATLFSDVWNEATGSAIRDATTYRVKQYATNVPVLNGDVFQWEATTQANEFAGIDYVEFY